VVFPGTVRLEGSVFTTIAGTVTDADPRAGESATEVAVMVTCKSLAGGGGAVYVVAAPLAVVAGEKLPQGVGAQDTVHATPLLLVSLPTVAINSAVPFASAVAADGVTLIVTDGTVITAALDFVGSATEVAVRVTFKSLAGGLFGTVYVTAAPLSDEVGETVPHGAAAQVILQFTPLPPKSFITLAEKRAVPPICTVSTAGETVTVIAGG